MAGAARALVSSCAAGRYDGVRKSRGVGVRKAVDLGAGESRFISVIPFRQFFAE